MFTDMGCTDTTFRTVIIGPEITIFIPNAFTPDGDGMNDGFSPRGSAINKEGYSLLIFDRWGDRIWATNRWGDPWPDTVNGAPAMQDVYVYAVRFRDDLNKRHEYRGTVMLIR